MTTGVLVPEENSYAENTVEAELQDIFLALFESVLKDTADEINCYGAPHIGSLDLVRRNLTADGLAVLSSSDEDAIRYLHQAWKFRNPRRGMHFLRTYVQALFGDYEINQLYQLKTGIYPLNLATEDEISKAGGSLDDYWLTSRVRVRLSTDMVSTQILAALKSTVAARIVLNVQIAKKSLITIGPGLVVGGVLVRSEHVGPQRVAESTATNALDLDFQGGAFYVHHSRKWGA
ncbi:hypothetical protein [Pseudomonas sp.]|jgi:hypothetical protein|uniref:hypothetical protein n=1 Tax=Pseudomonas sp. TaxID=306 RepID=UPI002ED9EA48